MVFNYFLNLFSGEEDSSTVLGVVTGEGLFEGKISINEGDQYVIAQSRHYFTDPQQFHSVIYRHSDVYMPKLEDTKCRSDEIHAKIRALQEAEEKRSTHSTKPHFHTRLKSNGKSYRTKHKPDNNDNKLKGNISKKSTMDKSQTPAFGSKESQNTKPNTVRLPHIPFNVHRYINRGLLKVTNDSAVSGKMYESGLKMTPMTENTYEQSNLNHDKPNHHQHPAKYQKSAQHHQHHCHHNHYGRQQHKHHHQDDPVTAFTSNDELQRLMDEFNSLDVVATDTNLDLEEIGIDRNVAERESDKRPISINIDTMKHLRKTTVPSLPKDITDVPVPSREDTTFPDTVGSDKQNDQDHVQMDVNRRNHSHHRQKRAMIDPARITCSLYLQADHLFFKKFHSNEETVIEQLTQHVQGVNEIYKAIGRSIIISL